MEAFALHAEEVVLRKRKERSQSRSREPFCKRGSRASVVAVDAAASSLRNSPANFVREAVLARGK